MAPLNLATKEHSYVDKLNFWNRCISVLINTVVSKRCYNSVGEKTKLVESFITEQLSVDKMFTEYVASTLISILTKKIVPLAIGLAKLYEEEAELYFALDSPENKHRVCHEFLRTVEGDEINSSNPYEGVIMMPIVALNSSDLLKEPFKFTKETSAYGLSG